MKVAATNARIDPNTTICSKSIAGALAAEKPNDLPHKKALTFSEDLNSTFDIPRLDEYTQNEKSELWYNTETIDDFRKKHRKEGRKTRKRFGAFVNAIEDLYLVVESISSDLNDETDFFEELKQLNADLNGDNRWSEKGEDLGGHDTVAPSIIEKNHRLELVKMIISKIKTWCMKEDLRGLEKVASTKLKDCRVRIKAGISALAVSSTYSAESFCNHYQDISRAPKLFAMIQGQADRMALGEYDDEPDESGDTTHSFIDNEIFMWKRS